MADFRAAAYAVDEGPGGGVSWPALLELAGTVAKLQLVPGDLLAALSDRLKSEATHVVLNTLTALHTICLNSQPPVHDQLCGSKVMKHLERLLNKPPFPGVEMAAAQLLMDWAFLYGQGQLGPRAFAALTSTSKHRAMLQAMAASDVAVMLMEDRKLGLPQFGGLLRGLDFQQQFATQFAAPLTGSSGAPGVLAQLARAAVATSYSGSSSAAAAAAAASRNTFAAWAERVQQDPSAAAQRVLNTRAQCEADLKALQAAQAACLATAKPLARQQQAAAAAAAAAHGGSSSSRPAPSGQPDTSVLRHELDKAYLMACKAAEWREMVQVLVQQRLPDSQLSALLALADAVNGVLDDWQQAATTELFWLLGVDTAGLADGSLLPKVVAAATATPGGGAGLAAAAAAPSGSNGGAAAAAAAAASQQQQQQQAAAAAAAAAHGRSLTRDSSSYLDLLTGDVLPPMSSTNPFLSAAPPPPPPPAQAQGAAAAAGAAPTPQLQSYLQELGVAPPGARPQQQQQQQHPPPMQLSSAARTSSASTGSGGSAPPTAHNHGQQQQQQQRQQATGRPARPLQSHSVSLGAAAGDTGGSGDNGAACSSSYINPFASLDTSAIMHGMRAGGGAAAATAAAGGSLQRRSTDSSGGAHTPFAAHHHQQQQQHASQPPPPSLLGQRQASAAAANSHSSAGGGGGGAAADLAQHVSGSLHLGAAAGEPPQAAPALPEQVLAQVQQLLSGAPSHSGPRSCEGGCAACGLPERAALQAGILRLLAAQQQHHEWRLAQLQQAHQAEVGQLKATAVQRFKQLMGQQQEQQ